MKVPFLDLTRQYRQLRPRVVEAIVGVCDSQRFILGPEVEALEDALRARTGVREAIGVSSGSDALLMALMALGVGPGDEVVTSPFSFFATAGAIARVGARPVFVDIDGSYLLDAAGLARAITPRTRAIIVVHLFGLCADMARVRAVADAAGVPVIEDAAQAIDARHDGLPAGRLGTIGCFSFFPTKNLGGYGDGGLVMTDQPELGTTLRLLRNHGAQPKYHHRVVGGNFRLDAIQAAVLRVKLDSLTEWTGRRRAHAQRYAELFSDLELDDVLRLPVEPAGRVHVYNQYVVRTSVRDELRSFLASQGVETEVYYPSPLHLQECFRSLGYRAGDFPEAEAAAREALALPIYPELTDEEQRYVTDCVGRFAAVGHRA